MDNSTGTTNFFAGIVKHLSARTKARLCLEDYSFVGTALARSVVEDPISSTASLEMAVRQRLHNFAATTCLSLQVDVLSTARNTRIILR